MLVANPCGSSSTELLYGGKGGTPALHEARQDSLAHLPEVGLRAAANLINFISNIVYLMVISQSGILLLLLFQRNMNF